MVNSCNSRSPILLDTPERATGAAGSTVIEIPDSGERNHPRRRRLESLDDVIVADSPKRPRVDVPVIDLTADNEEESSTADIDTERLLLSMHNSPRYARFLPDETRLRIRRAMSLRHRTTQHFPRHQLDELHSNLGSLSARTDPARNIQSGITRGENSQTTILVDDDDADSRPGALDISEGSGFSRPSCSRISPPRIPNTTSDTTRPLFSPSARSERSRLQSHVNVSLQFHDSIESDSERLNRNSRRDTSQHFRAVRRNQRRQRQLRERLGYISPLTNYSTNTDDNFESSTQVEPQVSGINPHDALASSFNETVPQRMIRRTPPAFPLDGQIRSYDIPDLLLPAVLSWWGPDSRLRHFGDADDEREDYEALWSLTERLGQVKPKGLSKADMEEIPAFRYSAASKDSSNGSCVVCMMNYSNKEKLRRLPCNHDFHAKCIDRWLKNNRSCPVCRKDVTAK